jgi:aminoglycoside phosphotransferase (APT) family kinase protein
MARMDKDRLEAYLRSRLGDVRIERLARSFPGLSRETWLVWLMGGDGVVVRVEPPGGGIVPTPFEREWRVYETLSEKTDIPVAEPLWFDADPEPSEGRPLFVRKLAEGDTYLPGLHDDTPEAAERRRCVAEEHASKLAQLHLLDWKAAGFGEFLDVPATVADGPRQEWESWSRIWHDVKSEAFPVVTEALGWFEAHLPKTGAALSLCKGNNGIGEEIWREDRIVAFSDWELASIGDPCYDWAMSQGMLDLWDRERILAYYEELTGFTLPPENFAFYRVWDIFKSFCALNAGLGAFIEGENRSLARATLGFGKSRLFEHLLGTVIEIYSVEEAADFVVQWRKNPYHDARISGD